MIKLYIGNRLVDIEEKIDIKMTYQSTDLSNPTAIKNSFSKSIELQGTPNNNDIFGNIYKLDFSVIENGEGQIGINFDARKRTPFELYSNGEAIECGYMQMNTIKINNGVISYNINLYGMLGDFMYGLMYNEDGTEKTLADIYYGFEDENGNVYSRQDEKTKYIIKWDKHYIKEGWDKLRTNDYSNSKPSTYIKACPTYSGFYEDFDNDKFLINYDSLDDNLRKNLFPLEQQFFTKNGYILGTAQREMDEWECRDLRSFYQRPAVKLSFIMNAIIKDNENYTVEWDDEIINSPYFKDTWIVFNRIDFDDDNEGLENSLEPVAPIYESGVQSTFLQHGGSNIIDTSSMQNPHAEIKLNINAITDNVGKNIATSYSTYKTVYDEEGKPHTETIKVLGGYMVKINIYDDSQLYYSSNWRFATTGWNGSIMRSFRIYYPNYLEKLSQYTSIPQDDIAINYIQPYYNTDTKSFELSVPLKWNLQLPISDSIKIEVVMQKVCFDEDGNSAEFVNMVNYDNAVIDMPINIKSIVISTNNSGYFDGVVSPYIQRFDINKDIIFGAKATAFDYLTSFTKLFNFRFETDIPNKRIIIKTRPDYYENEVIDINDKIDRKSITIKPSTIESKYYTYKLDDGDTYASILYRKRNKEQYGEYRFTSAYDFNRNVTDIFDDNVFSATIPYQQSSIFYNNVEGYYPFTLAPTYTFTQYPEDDKSEEITVNGYNTKERLYNATDAVAKVCLFDAENNNSSIDQCILFFDGFKGCQCQLTDNTEMMYVLNENPCHLISNDTDEVIKVNSIPQFWNYMSNENGVFTNSTDFYKPKRIFTPDEGKYSDETKTIFNYWINYLPDMYDKDSKSVEVDVMLNLKPREALKKFYYFDNAIWFLNKMTNYSIFETMHKCEFIKVLSIQNYLT